MLHLFSNKNSQTSVSNTIASEANKSFSIIDNYTDGYLKNEQSDNLYKARRAYAIQYKNLKENQDLVNDLDTLMHISTQLSNNNQLELTYWMSANTQDILVYFMLLHYLKKHTEKINIINISGLPFINEKEQLFFPSDLSELPEKEILKCIKLSRKLSPAEIETDSEEWSQIVNENALIRMLDGNKKIKNLEETYYDNQLLATHKEEGKVSTTVSKFIRKNKCCISPEFLTYRLQLLIDEPKTINE